jgi:hypothetical protein
MFGLAHADFGWIIAGAVAFLGIMSFGAKIMQGKILAVIPSIAVWIFVFNIHSGSTQGIMTATFCALLFDLIGLPILKLFLKK